MTSSSYIPRGRAGTVRPSSVFGRESDAAAALPFPRAHLVSYRVLLHTGVDLHYVAPATQPVVSPGTGGVDEALLLLHGYSDSWRSYEEVLAGLSRTGSDVPVFALDLRGHGESSRPASGAYTQPDFAADVAAFMEALQIRKAIVVGHSMGSLAAHLFAVQQPDKVKGLVLIGTVASLAGHPVVAELRPPVDAIEDEAAAPLDFVRDFQASCFYAPPESRVLFRYVAESLRLDGRTWKATLDGMAREDHRDRLRQLAVPTLILWGEQDIIFSKQDQDELMALIPGATFVSYPDAGHTLNVERAGAVVEAIRRFVAGLS